MLIHTLPGRTLRRALMSSGVKTERLSEFAMLPKRASPASACSTSCNLENSEAKAYTPSASILLNNVAVKGFQRICWNSYGGLLAQLMYACTSHHMLY